MIFKGFLVDHMFKVASFSWTL